MATDEDNKKFKGVTACGAVRIAERTASMTAARRARDVLDFAADAFIEMDRDDRITEWNRAAAALFGWSRDEVLGRTVTETIVPPQHWDACRRRMANVLATGTPKVNGKRMTVAGLDRHGREFPIELTLWSLKDGEDWRFHAFIRDITERERLRQKLEQLAYYDPLTGLPNRTLVRERLEQCLQRRGADGKELAVLFVDLDYFKRINDSIGHDAGDSVLRAVAERFRRAVRPMDTVARLAGDEFLVVCPELASPADAERVAERILAALADSVHVAGDGIFLTASIGLALATRDSTAEDLIVGSDAAMYRAKRSGRGRYTFNQTARRSCSSPQQGS